MKTDTLARFLLFPLAFAMTLAFAPARPAAAQLLDDFDEDGVLDQLDQCPDTPAGDLVDSEGCSYCPCEGAYDGSAWPSHQEYVDCTTKAAHRMRTDHQLTRKVMR